MSGAFQAINAQAVATRYRSDIDGLRAIAVVSVVLHHAHADLVPGGFTGVDIFFVISGYLITSILATELENNRFSILKFYERRIRRIFPALFWVLAASTIVAIWLLAPIDLAAYSRSLIYTTLFASNVFYWHESGYFDTASELKPLLHTWSLAVEEQFYIFFPLFLWLAWRLGRARLLILIAVAASLAFSIYGIRHSTSSPFYLLPGRAWELLIGSALAVGAIPQATSPRLREAAAWTGLGLILLGFLLVHRTTPFPGETALLPCVGAALVIYAGIDGTPTLAARLLSLKPLVFLGLISYSLYLWHWPVLVFARYASLDPLSPSELAFAVLASVLLATLSWRFVERPFRRGTSAPAVTPSSFFTSRRIVIGSGLAMMAIFIGLGSILTFVATDERMIRRIYTPEIAEMNRLAHQSSSPAQCLGSVAHARSPDCRVGVPGERALVALWGDSYADALVPALAEIDPAHAAYRFIFHSCPSILGTTRTDDSLSMLRFARACHGFNDEVINTLSAMPEIETVILVNNYNWYLKPPDKDASVTLRPDEIIDADDFKRRTLIIDHIAATAEQLASLGKRVVIFGAFFGRPDLGAQYALRGLMVHRDARARLHISATELDRNAKQLNDRLRHIDNPNIVFIDPHDVFCPDAQETGICSFDQGSPLTIDGNHFSVPGAHLVAAAMRRALAAPHQTVAGHLDR